MNTHPNNTIVIGMPGSYQYYVSCMTDILKGKPRSYEVWHCADKMKMAGHEIGLTKERMYQDFKNCHLEAGVKFEERKR